MNNIWGKLAAEILSGNEKHDTALEELKRIQQYIDESTFQPSLSVLQQRTWFIHWALFVNFFQPDAQKGRDSTIEMLLYQKDYLNVIQTTCPWILRYLCCCDYAQKKAQRDERFSEGHSG